ncbi:hypothetical protein Patl1_04445 [Pistacia atlantica]|uniref:Uncharacterized protein n=1 Tax=Pistacia atlantica TaxID=434234 RepID=A0ACC1BSZ5_9ROSI|nr:hypothetical protein Patl1_04445 [Pistacia atlantica]
MQVLPHGFEIRQRPPRNKANCISETKRENYSGSLKCLSKRTPKKPYLHMINLKSSSFSGLSKRTTTEGLKEAFSKFGEAVQARVVTDRVSGYSKGFGFVRYATLEDAAKGIEGMDGKFLDGWVIFAEYARPRAPPGPPSENMSSQYGHNMSSPYGRQ